MENMKDLNVVQENDETTVVNQEKTPEKKKGWKPIVGSFFIILLFLGIQIVAGIIGNAIFTIQLVAKEGADALTQEYLLEKITETGFMTNLLFITTVITMSVSLLWYYLGYVRKNKEVSKSNMKWNNGKTIFSLALTAIACYCFDLFLCFIVNWIIPSAMNDFSDMMGMAMSGSTLLAFILTVVLAPIGEEALLRGIILRRIAKQNPFVVAIVAQAILFGIYHANIVQGLYAIPIGLVLGYIAYRFNSILPCILVHAVNNFMPTLVQQLPKSILDNDAVFVSMILVVCIICSCIVYVLNKDFFRKENK